MILCFLDDESAEHDEMHASATKKRRISEHVHVFPCEDCERSFRSTSALENHHLLGNCSMRDEKILADRCKVMYQKKLSSFNTKSFTLEGEDTEESTTTELKKQTGWALKIKKAKTTFTTDQKEYLLEKFNIGTVTGHKEDPAQVAKDMPYAIKDGKKKIQKRRIPFCCTSGRIFLQGVTEKQEM
jgi:hypothetical protein